MPNLKTLQENILQSLSTAIAMMTNMLFSWDMFVENAWKSDSSFDSYAIGFPGSSEPKLTLSYIVIWRQ